MMQAATEEPLGACKDAGCCKGASTGTCHDAGCCRRATRGMQRRGLLQRSQEGDMP